MKLLFTMLFSFPAFGLQDDDIKIHVRGYQPVNYAQEIVKQEQLFRNIVVELEFTIEDDKAQDTGKSVVQVSPVRSLNIDPRF